MAQPTWNTSPGSIGAYIENKSILFQFSATPITIENTLKYVLLNGKLPKISATETMSLSDTGILVGTPIETGLTYTDTFTIRVNEYAGDTIIGFKDRTFSITVSSESVPRFISDTENLGSYNDSTWVSINLSYENPLKDSTIDVQLVDGELPSGLEIDSTGIIKGYATAPVNSNSLPITKIYNFVLKISNELQFSTTAFSITIVNQETLGGFSGRRPVIFNLNHPTINILEDDEYSSYYLDSTTIGTFNQSTKFQFKIIGHDFDGDYIQYSATGLNGIGTLTCNSATGWITGTLPTIGNNLNIVNITVTASKGSLLSDPLNLKFNIQGTINPEITWITSADLGIISNCAISTLEVVAKSTQGLPLTYTLSGILPAGLTLSSTGEIVGRVAFESTDNIQNKNEKNTYIFNIRATNPTHTFVTSEKQFKLVTNQTYTEPFDNLYMQAFPMDEQKSLYNTLINDTTIFPNNYIYRSADPYFGKSDYIIYHHLFGVPSHITNDYTEVTIKNHYKRDIVLSEIKTAIAKDSSGAIIYEVVYSEIVDDLINNDKKSVRKELLWPQKINNISTIVYPASLSNMREQITKELGSVSQSEMLPLWMRTVQNDGSTIGLSPVFVICYTKPGYSKIIQNNINTKWNHKLHDIQFTIDRFIVDRSFTYQFDPNTSGWQLPSDVTSTDDENSYVFFKKKNILN